MQKYRIILKVYATTEVTVEANSPQEAIPLVFSELMHEHPQQISTEFADRLKPYAYQIVGDTNYQWHPLPRTVCNTM